jgi:peptide-methionine (S)-S-oxide reductase
MPVRNLPHHERIEDAAFRRAVDLLDSGDLEGLRMHLQRFPELTRQYINFEDGNYFRNPTLLEFAAENPVRHGVLPANIVQIVRLILNSGAKENQTALDGMLGLVCSGRVPRECGVQVALIDLLCEYGAEPDQAILLVERGARLDLKDTIWQGTPAAWAQYAGRVEIERYLHSQQTR